MQAPAAGPGRGHRLVVVAGAEQAGADEPASPRTERRGLPRRLRDARDQAMDRQRPALAWLTLALPLVAAALALAGRTPPAALPATALGAWALACALVGSVLLMAGAPAAGGRLGGGAAGGAAGATAGAAGRAAEGAAAGSRGGVAESAPGGPPRTPPARRPPRWQRALGALPRTLAPAAAAALHALAPWLLAGPGAAAPALALSLALSLALWVSAVAVLATLQLAAAPGRAAPWVAVPLLALAATAGGLPIAPLAAQLGVPTAVGVPTAAAGPTAVGVQTAAGMPTAAALTARPAAAVPAAPLPLLLAGLLASLLLAAVLRHQARAWRESEQQRLTLVEALQNASRERDAARRLDAEKSRFLAIASHDLRQPVHALGLFASTLAKRLRSGPDEALGRNLVQSVDGLERSFNTLLDVSKLDAGALGAHPETFAVRDMFRRLHMQYAGQAEFAGLSLRFSPGGRWVHSDPQLLERMLGNLIQNAIKYTASGGIAVLARNGGARVHLEVWDTGCGVAPAVLPRIFDEFYQVGRPERDRRHGLGMGLAIVRRLARLQGHRLEVASTPGRGTLFRIAVPRGGLPGLEEELGPADTQPMPLHEPQMVLVVDDEEPIREGLRLLLQEWGLQVMTAADAAQAEQAVAALEGRVDLVLSDLYLGPGPDGTEVIAQVRRLCGREVPAILVTGDLAGSPATLHRGLRDPVLLKPVQPRRLHEVLCSALQ